LFSLHGKKGAGTPYRCVGLPSQKALAIDSSLMKSSSPQTLSCILRQLFSWRIFHLVWLFLIICQQCFLFNAF